MKFPTVFHVISAACREKKDIVCVLIGGFAVNYYRVTRQTADVDFLITKEDYRKIISFLQKEGFKIDATHDIFARLSSPQSYLMDIDFLFVDQETLRKITRDAREITIAGQKLLVPSLNHLIALKLHAIKNNPKMRGYKDLSDIIELIKVNKIKTGGNAFKDLCLMYGTKELYKKILERSR